MEKMQSTKRSIAQFSSRIASFYTAYARWFPTILLAYVAGLLIYQFIVSDISRVSQMKEREYQWYFTENNRLLTENTALKAELNTLTKDTVLIESLARSELGLVKPGEQFYTYGIQLKATPSSVATSPTMTSLPARQ